jgi:hypothetical protein
LKAFLCPFDLSFADVHLIVSVFCIFVREHSTVDSTHFFWGYPHNSFLIEVISAFFMYNSRGLRNEEIRSWIACANRCPSLATVLLIAFTSNLSSAKVGELVFCIREAKRLVCRKHVQGKDTFILVGGIHVELLHNQSCTCGGDGVKDAVPVPIPQPTAQKDTVPSSVQNATNGAQGQGAEPRPKRMALGGSSANKGDERRSGATKNPKIRKVIPPPKVRKPPRSDAVSQSMEAGTSVKSNDKGMVGRIKQILADGMCKVMFFDWTVAEVPLISLQVYAIPNPPKDTEAFLTKSAKKTFKCDALIRFHERPLPLWVRSVLGGDRYLVMDTKTSELFEIESMDGYVLCNFKKIPDYLWVNLDIEVDSVVLVGIRGGVVCGLDYSGKVAIGNVKFNESDVIEAIPFHKLVCVTKENCKELLSNMPTVTKMWYLVNHVKNGKNLKHVVAEVSGAMSNRSFNVDNILESVNNLVRDFGENCKQLPSELISLIQWHMVLRNGIYGLLAVLVSLIDETVRKDLRVGKKEKYKKDGVQEEVKLRWKKLPFDDVLKKAEEIGGRDDGGNSKVFADLCDWKKGKTAAKYIDFGYDIRKCNMLVFCGRTLYTENKEAIQLAIELDCFVLDSLRKQELMGRIQGRKLLEGVGRLAPECLGEIVQMVEDAGLLSKQMPEIGGEIEIDFNALDERTCDMIYAYLRAHAVANKEKLWSAIRLLSPERLEDVERIIKCAGYSPRIIVREGVPSLPDCAWLEMYAYLERHDRERERGNQVDLDKEDDKMRVPPKEKEEEDEVERIADCKGDGNKGDEPMPSKKRPMHEMAEVDVSDNVDSADNDAETQGLTKKLAVQVEITPIAAAERTLDEILAKKRNDALQVTELNDPESDESGFDFASNGENVCDASEQEQRRKRCAEYMSSFDGDTQDVVFDSRAHVPLSELFSELGSFLN